MKYYIAINKRYHYVRVYTVLKKLKETSNRFSRAFASLVDRLTLPKKSEHV